MNHKTLIASAITTSFVVGFYTGFSSAKKAVVAKLKDSGPLIATICVDLMEKGTSGTMTEEELKAYAREQMDFVNIISK